MEQATFGGGCFWCTEAIFKRLKGVKEVVSGYSGGTMKNPSYSLVSSGDTGHAETIQVTYDPANISYSTLLDVFFATHNPTTLNQQGADVGTQYRSVIFFHSDEQQELALKAIAKLEKEKKYDNPIITQVRKFEQFYKAEDYHQNYYDKNKTYPYCSVVIDPKITKLLTQFSEQVKSEYK